MVGTVTILLCLIVLLYVYRKRRMQLLQRAGVPVAGGEPNAFFGSMLAFRGMTLRERLQSWTKEYGKLYGYYEGPRANIVSSDLDFLQEIFVKQFSAFNGRKLYPLQLDPDSQDHIHMFFAQNERWKRLRKCANPAFSTSKMRQMFATINSDIDRFMKNMEAHCTKACADGFNVYEYYQRLTLDVIFECGFGVHINAQDNPDSIYLTTIRAAFSRGKLPVMLVISLFLYELRVFLRVLYGFLLRFGVMKNPFHDLGQNLVPRIVKMRYEAQETAHQKDLIQIMLDAHHEDSGNKSEISLPEIEAQINLFMLAGYETSSTTLAYCTYLLATHPAEQQRLQREVDDFYAHIAAERRSLKQKQQGGESEGAKENENGSGNEEEGELVPTYDEVNSDKLKYMEQAVHETLRMYPIAANIFNRMCMYDTEVKGIRITRGVNIIPDVWNIHYDPEIWGPEDPAKFCPDRFAPELHSARPQLATMSFGGGPRTCIGMRFAMMEIKMTLVRLLRKYTICECSRTEKPLQLREMDVITPKNGVFIRLEKRLDSHSG